MALYQPVIIYPSLFGRIQKSCSLFSKIKVDLTLMEAALFPYQPIRLMPKGDGKGAIKL
jgi:hypothetical protein